MKLYKILEELILEELVIVAKQRNIKLLTEGVAVNDVVAAINGMYNVNITYQDSPLSPPSKRYIQVYVLGRTDGEIQNEAIRAYQIQGGSKTSSNGWKIFRLDRILTWEPTNKKWYNPVSDYDASIPAYNQSGDKTLASVTQAVDPNKFGRVRSDINQNNNLQMKQYGDTTTS